MSDPGLSQRTIARGLDLNPTAEGETTCYDVVQGRASNAWFVFRHGSAEPLASARWKHRAVRLAVHLAGGRLVAVHVEDCPPAP
jgi:phage terminase large subunit-like protein